MAAAWGADVKDEKPSHLSSEKSDNTIYDQYDALPLGIGYETI